MAVGAALLVALGALADLSGALPWWSARPFKHWASANGRWLTLACLILIVACANLYLKWRSAVTELRRPSERDRALFEELEQLLPPDGETMRYMKERFDGYSWEHRRVGVFADVAAYWREGKFFDDSILEKKRKNFVEASQIFDSSINSENFWDDSNLNESRMKLPPPNDARWTHSSRDETAKKLRQAGETAVTAYDDLYRTGRKLFRT